MTWTIGRRQGARLATPREVPGPRSVARFPAVLMTIRRRAREGGVAGGHEPESRVGFLEEISRLSWLVMLFHSEVATRWNGKNAAVPATLAMFKAESSFSFAHQQIHFFLLAQRLQSWNSLSLASSSHSPPIPTSDFDRLGPPPPPLDVSLPLFPEPVTSDLAFGDWEAPLTNEWALSLRPVPVPTGLPIPRPILLTKAFFPRPKNISGRDRHSANTNQNRHDTTPRTDGVRASSQRSNQMGRTSGHRVCMSDSPMPEVWQTIQEFAFFRTPCWPHRRESRGCG